MMIRKCLPILGAAAICTAAAADQAWDPELDIDLTIESIEPLTSTSAGPDNFPSFDITATGPVVGFSFSGDYVDAGATSAWASDTHLEIFVNGQPVYDVGGFTGALPNNPWDFQGSQSSSDGFYAHGIGGEAWDGDGNPDFGVLTQASAGDTITFQFSNGWYTDSDNVIEWSNVVLTLHQRGAPTCVGDLTGNGVVGVPDLLVLIGEWGPCDDCDDCPADLNGDCAVGVPDLLVMIGAWGPCPDIFAGCGNPKAGDCCAANDTPHCDDEICCLRVCADDPFCCDVEWDSLCANAAVAQCEVCPELACGVPEAGDCCKPNDTPYCDDEECCELICAADPFCCDTEWDDLCADAANKQCEVCQELECGDPKAGDCCEATGTPYCDDEDCCECICACDPFCCDTSWDSLCAGSGLGGCGASNPDGPCTEECSQCLPEPGCGVAGTGDCCEANDTPYCDDEECCELICADDPFCCETEWDDLCAEAANKECKVCQELGCGDPGTGDCCEAQTGSPYCDDEECCELICAADPFCCDVNWDSLCAGAANNQCEVCAVEECGGPLTGDCCEANDTPYCDDEECCELICADDPFCCETEWDDLCAEAANKECKVCQELGCGDPGTGDCCEAQTGSPYCDDEECCELICAADPFCCDVNWDSLCAGAANNQCEVCQ